MDLYSTIDTSVNHIILKLVTVCTDGVLQQRFECLCMEIRTDEWIVCTKVDYIAYMPSLFDKIQDSFVVGSFDQNGFVRHQKYFDKSDEGVDVEGALH